MQRWAVRSLTLCKLVCGNTQYEDAGDENMLVQWSVVRTEASEEGGCGFVYVLLLSV